MSKFVPTNDVTFYCIYEYKICKCYLFYESISKTVWYCTEYYTWFQLFFGIFFYQISGWICATSWTWICDKWFLYCLITMSQLCVWGGGCKFGFGLSTIYELVFVHGKKRFPVMFCHQTDFLILGNVKIRILISLMMAKVNMSKCHWIYFW